MSSLDDLSKNAIPPESAVTSPAQYVPGPDIKSAGANKSNMKEVKAESLGEPAPPPPPNIYQKWMDDLDVAIEKDKQKMWPVLEPAKDALESNMKFGEGGEEAYFNGEIGADVPIGATAAPTIEIPKEVAAKENITVLHEYPNATQNEDTGEDDFLSDDSIYKEEGETTDMTINETITKPTSVNPTNTDPSQQFLPGFEHYANQGRTIEPIDMPETTPKPTVNPMQEEAAKHVAEEPAKPVARSNFAESQVEAGTINQVPTEVKLGSDSLIDDAFADAEDEIAEGSEGEVSEDIQAMRDLIKTNIKPVNNVIDLRSYKIASKPITAGKALDAITSAAPTAIWPLPASKTAIILSALKGTEIDLLANRRPGQTDLMRNEEIVKTFYNHVTSPKPESWKAWAKTIIYDDFSHLYFGEYVAAFAKSNFAPFECEKDKHQFMQPIDIMSMVKYKNDEAKAYCQRLIEKGPVNTVVHSELRQISDNVAIAFRKPTVWNVMFEDYYLPEKVRNELSDIVAIFRHVEDMYIIDQSTQELRPIDTKPDPSSITKTLKNRFKIYYDVLKSLTSDQLNSITPIMSELHKELDYMQYQYPETTCPKCGAIVKPEIQQPIDILFTRHRLQIILA